MANKKTRIARIFTNIFFIEFVWITDGGGWTSARRNLEETFDVMEHLYNIADMEQKIFTSLFV